MDGVDSISHMHNPTSRNTHVDRQTQTDIHQQLTELTLTVLIFLTAITRTVLPFLTKLALTVPIFLTELVLTEGRWVGHFAYRSKHGQLALSDPGEEENVGVGWGRVGRRDFIEGHVLLNHDIG